LFDYSKYSRQNFHHCWLAGWFGEAFDAPEKQTGFPFGKLDFSG